MRVLTAARKTVKEIEYPTSDGRPMAETDVHYFNFSDSRDTLDAFFEPDPMVYVSGNLLLYYVEGDKRKHVSPDVFVVQGVEKKLREYYLLWIERKSPSVVFEFTSKSTKNEDLDFKYHLYRDTLKVQEYFLFDPYEEYLEPSMQGFRLRGGKYLPIKPERGRLLSRVLNLWIERDGWRMRFVDPRTGQRIPTPKEAEMDALNALHESEIALHESEAARERIEAENERLRQELETLRRQARK